MDEAGSDVAAQAAAVRVLAVSRLAPSAPGDIHCGGRLKLSFFDTMWIVLPPIQRVFLYELVQDSSGDDERFPTVVERLKRALADTLAHYLPLAGRLEHVAETGDVVLDWSDAGVAFVEAEGDIDVARLVSEEEHDTPAFRSLVPELHTRALPSPVLSVQATRLGDGMAVGVSVHHAVADGRAIWRFMEAWASASRVGSPVTEALGPPHYRRDAVALPNDDELAREMLKTLSPNLPAVKGQYDFSQQPRRARRTFYLGTDDITSLRRRIDDLASAEAGGSGSDDAPSNKTKPVSTFVALAALGWTAFVRSRGFGAGVDTYLMFLADLRARIEPPVSEAYLGNCVRACIASCADASELLGEAGILRAARAVQAAVSAMKAAPLAGTDKGWIPVMRLPFHRTANVAASPRFRAYDAADFGFGKPARAELVSMNHDGEMVLVGGRHDGEVQVSVSIDPAHMDAFKACILGNKGDVTKA